MLDAGTREEHSHKYYRYDVTILGAGPGGLFAAYEMKKKSPNLSIAIVDVGVGFNKRSCPLVSTGKCSGCDLCLAVYGFGGAGMYSDGKLSSYPAGSGLASHIGSEAEVVDLNRRAVEKILEAVTGEGNKSTFGKEVSGSDIDDAVSRAKLELKSYDVRHVGTEGVHEFCVAFEQELLHMGIEFHWLSEAIGVDKDGEMYSLRVRNRRGGEASIRSPFLVLATGKASGHLTRKILDQVSAQWDYNAIEIGVRVEAPREAVSALSACHLDAKIKMVGLYDTEVRTFCICDGGYLVSCYYNMPEPMGRICTISGFSFKEQKSENSNFGLLIRKSFPVGVDPMSVAGGIVRTINSLAPGGGTVVQRYGDFLRASPTTAEKLEKNSVKSSLQEAVPTKLQWVLPSYVCDNINLVFQRLAKLSPLMASEDTLLHAPVMELVNDRVALSPEFETTSEGLYVVGDASGVARGIVQSASTGMIAASSISRKLSIASKIAS